MASVVCAIAEFAGRALLGSSGPSPAAKFATLSASSIRSVRWPLCSGDLDVTDRLARRWTVTRIGSGRLSHCFTAVANIVTVVAVSEGGYVESRFSGSSDFNGE